MPIAADECTTNQRRVSYARVLIEVDVFKPLPKAIFLEDEQIVSTGEAGGKSLGDAPNVGEREWVQVNKKKKSKGKEVCSEDACLEPLVG